MGYLFLFQFFSYDLACKKKKSKKDNPLLFLSAYFNKVIFGRKWPIEVCYHKDLAFSYFRPKMTVKRVTKSHECYKVKRPQGQLIM